MLRSSCNLEYIYNSCFDNWKKIYLLDIVGFSRVYLFPANENYISIFLRFSLWGSSSSSWRFFESGEACLWWWSSVVLLIENAQSFVVGEENIKKCPPSLHASTKAGKWIGHFDVGSFISDAAAVVVLLYCGNAKTNLIQHLVDKSGWFQRAVGGPFGC